MPPTGDLFRCTVSYQSAGGLNQNVLHFQGQGGIETLEALKVECESFLLPSYQAVVSNNTTITGAVVQQLTPAAYDAAVVEFNETGDVIGPPGNAQLAAVLTLRSGLASRRKRGRLYLGGMQNGWTQSQQLSAAALAALGSWRDSLTTRYVGDAATSSFRLVIYSRVEGGDGPTYSLTGATPVERIDIQPTIRVQRRRRAGVGA